MQCPAVGNAWQYGTDCSGQMLFTALGQTAVARSHGGLSADQVVVQSGTHLWAGFVAIRGAVGQVKKLGKFVGTLFSDPVEVGTFEVSDDGVAIIDFVVPNVPAGEHHLELRGDDGSMYRMPILVTDTPVIDGPVGYVVDGVDGARSKRIRDGKHRKLRQHLRKLTNHLRPALAHPLPKCAGEGLRCESNFIAEPAASSAGYM